MSKEHEVALIDKDTLKDKIYNIRGQKVMLDFELAEIYGYTTKAFNQQVKNNVDKFEEDFRFQLTKEEVEQLSRSKNLTLKRADGRGSNFKYRPYAFTEQGIYMLMTVLRGDLAARQSKALIRTFKQMKDFVLNNQNLIGQREYLQLSMQVTNNVLEIQDIKHSLREVDDRVAKVIDTLGEVVEKSELSKVILDFSNPVIKREYLVLNGEPVEATLAYKEIYSQAKKSIFVIDNYIGIKTLILLKDISDDVEVTIFSDNIGKGLHQIEYDDFHKQYPKIKLSFKEAGSIFHDRYIILDWKTENEKIYHCGASSKDAGNKVMTIAEMMERGIYESVIIKLLSNQSLVLK